MTKTTRLIRHTPDRSELTARITARIKGSIEKFKALPESEQRAIRAAQRQTWAAQRESWVVGVMMLEHPELTREQATALYRKTNEK